MSTEHEAPEIGGEVVSATPLPSADSTDQLQPSVASISNRGDDGGSDKGDEDVPMTFPQRVSTAVSVRWCLRDFGVVCWFGLLCN